MLIKQFEIGTTIDDPDTMANIYQITYAIIAIFSRLNTAYKRTNAAPTAFTAVMIKLDSNGLISKIRNPPTMFNNAMVKIPTRKDGQFLMLKF